MEACGSLYLVRTMKISDDQIAEIDAVMATDGKQLTDEQKQALKARPSAHAAPIIHQLKYVISGETAITYPFAVALLSGLVPA